jgi:EAL domain-containing protein (putative c-di-GMP-specific phosphodiesterase class I)
VDQALETVDKPRLAILDDEPSMLSLLSTIGARAGFEPKGFSSVPDFLQQWLMFEPDLILLDLGLVDGDGMQVLADLAQTNCGIPILIVTGFDERVAGSAANFGEGLGLTMLPPLRKPFEIDDAVHILKGYAATSFRISADDVVNALQSKKIEAYYQPIIDISTGLLVGAESHIFCRHDLYGLIPGQRIEQAADRAGVRADLISEVTRQALATLAATENLTMGVQIPIATLSQDRFADMFAAQVRAAGVRANQIVIELSEATAMRDPAMTSAAITRLRIKGFRVALDDFGLGYSSLIELQRMPISQINIDQLFVAKVGSDESARTISSAIIGLGHSLQLQVCADGVLDAVTLAALSEIGCDMARGSHFAPYMNRIDFLSWVRDHKRVNQPANNGRTVTLFPTAVPSGDAPRTP